MCACSMSNFIHDCSPAFKSNDNEYIKDALQDVVKRSLTEVRVPPVNTLPSFAWRIDTAEIGRAHV